MLMRYDGVVMPEASSSAMVMKNAVISAWERLWLVVSNPTKSVSRTAGSQPLSTKGEPPMAKAMVVRINRDRIVCLFIRLLLPTTSTARPA